MIVPARLLPSPHNPSRCLFYDPSTWDSALPLAQQRARWSSTAAGRWNECRYHSTDWKLAAAAACWVLAVELERDPDGWTASPFTLASRYPHVALTEMERSAVYSLLWEPISWTVGSDMVMDGQHRSCALRVSGAIEVPVLSEA